MDTRYMTKLNSFAAGATFVAAAIGLLIVTAPSGNAADPLFNGATSPAPQATLSKGSPVAPFTRDPRQDVRDEYSFTNSGTLSKAPAAARVASERDPRCDVRDECTSSIAYREPVSKDIRVTQERAGDTVVR